MHAEAGTAAMQHHVPNARAVLGGVGGTGMTAAAVLLPTAETWPLHCLQLPLSKTATEAGAATGTAAAGCWLMVLRASWYNQQLGDEHGSVAHGRTPACCAFT